ncbi:hypothetical protein [Eisenibacter elegans]|jgi:hypothetical protein|uniref:hypothetical protein n=1 Tax=Eisenibacter elegans TaxID=997 RepID=UPI0004011D44|nr:hypothetical protein [Eisenibacter elegans]
MKKHLLQFSTLMMILCLLSYGLSAYKPAEAPLGDVTFSIKNDTGSSFRIYDGKGYYTINNMAVKKVTVEEGRKFYNGDGGKKGKLLFEASSSMSGKTLKLSDYL